MSLSETTERVRFRFDPRPWQAFALLRMVGFLRMVLLIHRRAGKTELAIAYILKRALKCRRLDGQYAYIAPLLKQAKMTAWARLKLYASGVPGWTYSESDLWVEVPNEAGGRSRVYVFGADNPDGMRGIHLDGCVLDELAQMKRDTWEVVVSVALLDRRGWAMFIGTVKGITLLSELYHKAIAGELGPSWMGLRMRWQDTQVFTEDELTEIRKDMRSDAQFRQEMECDETAAVEEALIPMDLIVKASGASLREEAYSFAAKVIGVDVAYSHDGDRSVIFKRQGLASFTPWIKRGVDNMTLAAEIARQYDHWNADAIFVDAGRGEGVISRLRQLNYPVTPVEFGGKAQSPHFANKKAEILFAIKEWLEQGGVLPDLPEIRTDLAMLTMDRSDKTDRLAVTSDDKMPSPDTAAALGCTFAFPVQPRVRTLNQFEQMLERRSGGRGETYDPFASLK